MNNFVCVKYLEVVERKLLNLLYPQQLRKVFFSDKFFFSNPYILTTRCRILFTFSTINSAISSS